MKKPNFFIVGAPKCGTTAMYTYLQQHPNVFMPEVKEPHFFATDMEAPGWSREMGEYLALFSNARDETAIGEASVWYLYSEEAASNIKQFCPSAKIIIMLRNPVDMLFSLHAQRLISKAEDIQDFEDALAAEDDRKRGLRLPKDKINIKGLFYREVVKYTDQVQRYIDVFGLENLHIIIYDDFRRDTPAAYRATLQFLGLSDDFRVNLGVVNAAKRVRSNVIRDFLRHPPVALQKTMRILLPQSFRRKMGRTLWRLNTPFVPLSPMKPELKRRLELEFRPEIERLSTLLGRDFTSLWLPN